MIPDGLKEQFEFYRKWFKTLLIKEFLNLPSDYQNQFIVMVKKFLEDCIKIHEEGRIIKEKLVELTIENIKPQKDASKIIYCTSPGLNHRVIIQMLKKQPNFKIGTKLHRMVFSVDEKIWYSSKEELIRKLNP
jgi:hypothetical protein